ncbi:MAG: hypothetical protein ACTSUY_12420, partial [Alphaproteobacteria bacterium]
KSRIKSALDDFESYLDNPLGFRPSTQTRERKTKAAEIISINLNSGATGSPSAGSGRSTTTPPASSDIFPIPIRSDLIVRIQGLPFDLTKLEAQKISNVILAMAMGST